MMLNKIKKSLKSNDGNGLIWGVVIVLILLIIFTSVSEYIRNNIILNGTRDALESIATDIATENYNEIYPNARQGYFASYQISNTDKWEEKIDKSNIDKQLKDLLGVEKEGKKIDKSNIDKQLKDLLGVEKEGNKYVKRYKSNGKVEYTLSNLKLKIDNPRIAPTTDKNKEKFIVEITSDIELDRLYNIFYDVDKVKKNL